MVKTCFEVENYITFYILQIPGATSAAIAAIQYPADLGANVHISRICGRYLSYIADDANTTTVCSKL